MTETWTALTRRKLLALGGAAIIATGATLTGPAFAQGTYPSKTITVVCAFPPGSGADVLVRFFATKMAEVSGAKVIVENKPGALANIATEYAARAAPDGYTVYIHSPSALAGTMAMLKNPPVDIRTDLNTVATTHKQGMLITVRADSPYKTLADLVEDQKAKGDRGTYAANNASGVVLAEEFKQLAGLQTTGVQYASAPDSLNDMMSGHIDWGSHDPIFSQAQMREGRFRALAIGSGERMAGIPDVPTFKEQGYELDQLVWWGVMVPKAVPQEIVTTINGWFAEILSQEDTKEFIRNSGGDPLIYTPEQAQKFTEDSVVEWKRLVELAKIPQK